MAGIRSFSSNTFPSLKSQKSHFWGRNSDDLLQRACLTCLAPAPLRAQARRLSSLANGAGWLVVRDVPPQEPAEAAPRTPLPAPRPRRAFTGPARRPGPAQLCPPPSPRPGPAGTRRGAPACPDQRSRGKKVPESQEGAQASLGRASSGGRARETPATASPTSRQRQR